MAKKTLLYLRTQFAFNLKSGGSVTHTSGVIEAMSNRFKLKVISNDELEGVRETVTIIRPKRSFLPRNIRELLFSRRLTKEITDDFDFIYHRHSSSSFIGAYLSKKFKKPFILEFNSSEVWELKNWDKKQSFPLQQLKYVYRRLIRIPLASWVENYNLENATVVATVSEELRSILHNLKVPDEKIVVYPNGVDPVKYRPEISSNKVLSEYNIKDKKVLGFIGSFGPWHGILELAKSIVLFFENHPEQKGNTIFLLVGDGLLADEAKNIIRNGNVSEHVIFTGQVAQNVAPSYLAACDVLLSPHIPNPDGTKFFGSPTKLFEYMAMAKGIVASDLEQIGQILEHEKNAILVQAGNIEQLSSAMYRLICEDKLRERIGTNARQEVIKNYTWDRHVEVILEKLEKTTGVNYLSYT